MFFKLFFQSNYHRKLYKTFHVDARKVSFDVIHHCAPRYWKLDENLQIPFTKLQLWRIRCTYIFLKFAPFPLRVTSMKRLLFLPEEKCREPTMVNPFLHVREPVRRSRDGEFVEKKKHTTSSFESTKALCVKGAAILSSAVSSLHLKIDRVNRGPANLRRHAPYCGCGFLTLVCWLFSYASLLFLCVNSFISERSMGSVLSRFDSIVFVRLFLMYRILIQFLTYVCDLILYVLEYWSFLLIW